MPPHLASAANVNHFWAALLVEELVRQGVGLFVVCPGSRSTPLAVAVAENPKAEALVHWDERAAAFVALGWGKATGRPAAVITTSGTAVANLVPAAVESRQSGIPLLLLTADRPPELRETGANQAVRQNGLFSTVARWEFDLGAPTPGVDPAFVLTTAAQAVARAQGPAGPVHLNCPFREPLAPTPDGLDPARALDGLERWATSDVPFSCHAGDLSRRPAPRAARDVAALLAAHADAPGVIVVGPQPPGSQFHDAGIVRLAEHLGWPILSDVLANLRTNSASGTVIDGYDLALGSECFRREVCPRVVLQFGGRPTSKRLVQWIAAVRPEVYVVVHPEPERLDPTHRVTFAVRASPGSFADLLLEDLGRNKTPAAPRRELERWQQAAAAVQEAVEGERRPQLDEPFVARRLARWVKPEHGLVVAASMPIRDLDTYALRDGRRLHAHVAANRGASGIDGTVAAAVGFARGLGQPTTLLIGDLALLHDQTSLALLRDGPPLTVVCVNNDGGGIFHRLPIANGQGGLATDTFERMFGTPHGLAFEHAAAQVGLAYHRPDTVEAFDTALDDARRSGASALIEVRTDRGEQAALRVRIEAAAAAAVDALVA